MDTPYAATGPAKPASIPTASTVIPATITIVSIVERFIVGLFPFGCVSRLPCGWVALPCSIRHDGKRSVRFIILYK